MAHTIRFNRDLGVIVLRAKQSMDIDELEQSFDELVNLPGFKEGLLNSPMGGFASGMRLFPGILALGFGVTILVGLLSGLVPAIRSAQRPIADGLRQVG